MTHETRLTPPEQLAERLAVEADVAAKLDWLHVPDDLRPALDEDGVELIADVQPRPALMYPIRLRGKPGVMIVRSAEDGRGVTFNYLTHEDDGEAEAPKRPGATITINGGNPIIRVLIELLREGIRDAGGDPVKVISAKGPTDTDGQAT